MKYWLSLILLVSVVAAAQDPERPRHDKYRDDPHARCMRPEVVEHYGPDNPSLHPCECHQTCVTSDTGEQWVQEDANCQLYCTKERCGCHPDEDACPAPMPEPRK